jgi:hypothetical protein
VATADAACHRIERDLHDGARQRRVSLALTSGIWPEKVTRTTACVREEQPILRLCGYLTVLRALIDEGGADFDGQTLIAHPPQPATVAGWWRHADPRPRAERAHGAAGKSASATSTKARFDHEHVVL